MFGQILQYLSGWLTTTDRHLTSAPM